MIGLNENAAAIWRKVAAIEQQIAEETRWQRQRMAELERERDKLLLRLVDLESSRNRRLISA